MKLQEKFKNTFLDMPYIDNENDYCIVRGCLTEQSSVKCAEIAINFAMNALVWAYNSHWILASNDLWYFKPDGNTDEGITTEELLKIFEDKL